MATPAAGGGLEAKHYILAAFTAGFIAVAVVTIVFVVLSPARISFSVTSAGSHDLGDGGVHLDLNIVAHNPSRRAAVWYQSIVVVVRNSTAAPNWEGSAGARVSVDLPLEQPRRNETKMNATVTLVGRHYTEKFTGNKTSHSFSVMVTAVARFKVGVAWTKRYNIKVTCGNVDFFGNKSSTAAGCNAA